MLPDPIPLDVDALAGAVAHKLADQLADRLAAMLARRFLSVSDAAQYAGVSADSIRSLISSGKLTALRPVPGRIVIDRREIDSLLASSTKRPRRGRGVYGRQAGGREDV
jgi:excisionase family DNA binding protein